MGDPDLRRDRALGRGDRLHGRSGGLGAGQPGAGPARRPEVRHRPRSASAGPDGGGRWANVWVRVLGSAAGGGFPQWNCACPQCRAVRDASRPARPRTQCSIAVSGDRRRWYLINASPDLRAQIESFPALHPSAGPGGVRQVPFRTVLLTDAELDHTLGLLLLREGGGLELHATEAVHDTLCRGTAVLRTLETYCQVDWQPVVPGVEVSLGEGLSYRAFDVPTTKPPPFGSDLEEGRVVGFRLTDRRSGRALVYLPGVQELTAAVRAQLEGCECL